VDPLGGEFGPDKRRRLVVTCKDGDVIEFRPERTRQTVTVRAVDLYRFALRSRAGLIERKARAWQKANGGRLASARKAASAEILR
jgi:hypothetical protein